MLKRRNMKKYSYLFISVLLLSSCNVYKSYKREKVSTDQLFGTTVEVKDTITLASLGWKEVFTDSKLQALIEKGLAQNTDLGKARLSVEQAKAALLSSRLSFLPSLAFAPQGTVSSFDHQKASQTYQLPITASWELDVFGRLRNMNKSSKSALMSSKAYQQAVQTQLVSTISTMYYTLVMLDRQIEITKQTVVSWQETLRATKAMMEAGHANQIAVARIEANVAAVQTALVDLEGTRGDVESHLCVILGDTPHAIVCGSYTSQVFPEALSVGVPMQLLSNRPDVRASEFALQQSFYGVNVARSAFYPNIQLNGSAGWTNSVGGIIFSPAKFIASAVGSLTQPLFNKGANIANLKIAKARHESAKLDFQQSLLNAGYEVNTYLSTTQSARQKKELRIQQVASLKVAVEQSEALMNYSQTTYLDVLTAQKELLQAELNQVADWFSEAQGVVNLYHALGGGTH